MDTLQLQDVFAPYYDGREDAGKHVVTRGRGAKGHGATTAAAGPDRKARLERVTRRLASARRRSALKGQ